MFTKNAYKKSHVLLDISNMENYWFFPLQIYELLNIYRVKPNITQIKILVGQNIIDNFMITDLVELKAKWSL